MTTTATTKKPPFRPIAQRACADAILNACDPNDPSKGVRESGGNNRGKAVETYLKMVGLGKGNPWCAAFLVARFLLALARLHELGVACALPSDFPITGACAVLKAWAKKHKLWRSVADIKAGRYVPREGDILIFDWDDVPGNDHTGIVRDFDADDKIIYSVEGNTKPGYGVSRESTTGDGVWKKSRRLSELGIGGGVIQVDF